MIRDLFVSNVCPASGARSDVLSGRYALKPTKYGEALDFDLERPAGKSRHARWCVGVEIKYLSRKAIRHELLPNVIHYTKLPLPIPMYMGQVTQTFADRTFLFGRERGLECDTELLKLWPQLCHRYHGLPCYKTRPRWGHRIRLIDTKRRCIVSTLLSETQQKDYVALSYVWGNTTQQCDGAATSYSSLFARGSLLNLKLPRTISDAILLVQRLNLRYLWVNALCIHQDDLSDKHEQIANMGHI